MRAKPVIVTYTIASKGKQSCVGVCFLTQRLKDGRAIKREQSGVVDRKPTLTLALAELHNILLSLNFNAMIPGRGLHLYVPDERIVDYISEGKRVPPHLKELVTTIKAQLADSQCDWELIPISDVEETGITPFHAKAKELANSFTDSDQKYIS